jgi:inner membrane protein
MATICTHSVVGLGLARLYADRPMPWTYWVLAAALPVIPDLDAFSKAAYGTPLGHRGITHSLLFALALSIVAAGATFRRFGVRFWPLAGLFSAIAASHGLLDATTIGGEGIPFFWPFGGRYGNWGPLRACDMTLELPGVTFIPVARSELLWVWLPVGVVVGLMAVFRRWRQKGASVAPVADQAS